MMLLVNETKVSFITSDNPIVPYNQIAELKKWFFSGLGMGSRGIEFFFPISPKIMLFMYDQWAYKVGEKNRRIVAIYNEEDIHKLNLLQCLNSANIIYFGKDVKRWQVEKYYNDSLKYPKANVALQEKIPIKRGSREAWFRKYRGCEVQLQLSFVSFRTNAKRIVPTNGGDVIRPEQLKKMDTNQNMSSGTGFTFALDD